MSYTTAGRVITYDRKDNGEYGPNQDTEESETTNAGVPAFELLEDNRVRRKVEV